LLKGKEEQIEKMKRDQEELIQEKTSRHLLFLQGWEDEFNAEKKEIGEEYRMKLTQVVGL